eukprot:TRINITY_DN93554_c0_g1_i1.p1 TRINITY_DN93554_c0_g1~~TRINITY_DN93554_c0_g1_i1.p1  ORF type:complete len:434 (-),score=27.10 TRINITY_DN93554_c0_g1_i1:141-1421(-)
MLKRVLRLQATFWRQGNVLILPNDPCEQIPEPFEDFGLNVLPWFWLWWKMKYIGDIPRQKDTYNLSYNSHFQPYDKAGTAVTARVLHAQQPGQVTYFHRTRLANKHRSLSAYKWDNSEILPQNHPRHPPKKICIFGGSGFLGTRTVQRLLETDWVEYIRIPTRFPEEHTENMPEEWKGKVEYVFCDIADKHNCLAVAAHMEGVINMIGGREEVEYSLHEQHVLAADYIATSAYANGCHRYVYIASSCAANNSPSKYSWARFRGIEHSIMNFPDVTIFRVAPMFGKGCEDVRRWKKMSLFLPFYPCFGANFMFNPVHVDDVAAGIVSSLAQYNTIGHTFEAAGPEEMTHKQMIKRMQKLTGRRRITIPMPIGVGVYVGWMASWMPRPFFTHDTFIILQYHDMIAAKNLNTLENLGVRPRSMEAGWNE